MREPKAAVLDGHLHAEGADLAQRVHHLGRILAGRIDLDRIDDVAEHALELGKEVRELRAIGLLDRIRVHEVQAEAAQEQFLEEAVAVPGLLSRCLREFACFQLFFRRAHVEVSTDPCAISSLLNGPTLPLVVFLARLLDPFHADPRPPARADRAKAPTTCEGRMLPGCS